MARRVAVVGGGITGLAAAHALQAAGAEVVLLEAGDRLGGKIHTEDFDGLPVDTGPDAFLARVPWATALCRELGLGDQLVSPSSGAWIWSRGRLHALPDGLVLGVPARLRPLARSGILSPLGRARAGLDVVLPRRTGRAGDGDVAVGRLVRARLGHEVAERLVDPLVGGINAGDADHLSTAAAVPQLADVARRHRSLVLGLRAQRRANPPDPAAPVFYSLPGGLGVLVDALAAALGAVDVRMRTRVTALTPAPGGFRLDTEGPDGPADLPVGAVVLATPAFVTAPLLAGHVPAAAAHLGAIEHASVALTLMAFPSAAVPGPLEGTGLLVPRPERTLTTAVTWASSKWPHLARPDRVLLRVSAGRHGDRRALELDDGDLVSALLPELERIMGIRDAPAGWRVHRWERSFPQYTPGHLDRVAAVEAAVAEALPGVALAGAAYRGVGIPACIRQGQQAAQRVLAHLDTRR